MIRIYYVTFLQAILDTCCDKAGFITVWGDELNVNTEGDYLLTDPECLITLLLSSSLSWSPPTLRLFFKALLSLLRDDHPHREFNACQLNRVHSLDAILYFCKVKNILILHYNFYYPRCIIANI